MQATASRSLTFARARPSCAVLIVALAGSLGATVVAAQTIQSAPANAASPPAAGTSDATSLEEVTVTARKVEERLIDVPVVGSVMNATALQRYDSDDLEQLDSQVLGRDTGLRTGQHVGEDLPEERNGMGSRRSGHQHHRTIHADPINNKPLVEAGDLTGYLHPPREVTLQVTRRF